MLKRRQENIIQQSEQSAINQEAQMVVYTESKFSDCEYQGVSLENDHIHYHVPPELSSYYLGVMLFLKMPNVEQIIYKYFAAGIIKPHQANHACLSK